MKAKLLLMTLSVAALASCSNDETLDTNRSAISFRSLVEGMTRGTSVTVANLDQFKVTAVGNGKVYMDQVAVNGSESGAKWATEGTYYWPAFQLDFYGYAPADAQGVTLNETTRTIADFTPAQKVEEQKDLVIACNTGTKESNQETGVPMNFRHALSQVVVKAKCPAENMKVEVIGIKVANVAGKGTFTFPADVTTGKDTRQLDFSLWSGRRGSADPALCHPCRSRRTEGPAGRLDRRLAGRLPPGSLADVPPCSDRRALRLWRRHASGHHPAHHPEGGLYVRRL